MSTKECTTIPETMVLTAVVIIEVSAGGGCGEVLKCNRERKELELHSERSRPG